MLGGAAFLPLQALAILSGETAVAGLSSACAATVIIASSLAAWRARKIARWFGQAGIAGGIAVLAVGLVEGARRLDRSPTRACSHRRSAS